MVRMRIKEDVPIPMVISSVDFLHSSTIDADKESYDYNSSKTCEKYQQVSLLDVSEEVASSTLDYSSQNSVTVTTNKCIIPVIRDLYSILSAVYEDEVFETGIINPSEKYFSEDYKRDALGALNTLQLLFWNNFNASNRKINILVGVLHTISHLSYKDIYPIGVSMAVSALNHQNQEVCEYAIKCFENWNHPDGIQKLKAVRFAAKWLEEYALAVIEEIDVQ